MSPTSLSVANVGAHLLVALISFGIFHVAVNATIVIGFIITLGALLAYCYVVARYGAKFDEGKVGPNCCEQFGSWFSSQLVPPRPEGEGQVVTVHSGDISNPPSSPTIPQGEDTIRVKAG